jgi:hypothetical protein
MVDYPTPKSPPKTPPKDADGLSLAAPKKPDDQSSGSPKSSDMVEGSKKTSPKNDGDAIASPNDDVQSHSPPTGVDESCTSPKDDAQSHSPLRGVDESCMPSGRAEGSPGISDSTRYVDESPCILSSALYCGACAQTYCRIEENKMFTHQRPNCG